MKEEKHRDKDIVLTGIREHEYPATRDWVIRHLCYLDDRSGSLTFGNQILMSKISTWTFLHQEQANTLFWSSCD